MLRDPSDDNVIPVVEDLRRRLKQVSDNRDANGDGKELPSQQDETGDEDGMCRCSFFLFGNCSLVDASGSAYIHFSLSGYFTLSYTMQFYANSDRCI